MTLTYFEDDKLPFRAKKAEAKSWYNRNVLGFYVDRFEDDTLIPFIFRLTSKHGKQRILTGYQESNGEGYVVDMKTIYADEGDAGERAFDLSRDEADKMRDADYAYNAGEQTARLVAEKRETSAYLDHEDSNIAKMAAECIAKINAELNHHWQWNSHDSFKEGYDNAEY